MGLPLLKSVSYTKEKRQTDLCIEKDKAMPHIVSIQCTCHGIHSIAGLQSSLDTRTWNISTHSHDSILKLLKSELEMIHITVIRINSENVRLKKRHMIVDVLR